MMRLVVAFLLTLALAGCIGVRLACTVAPAQIDGAPEPGDRGP